MLNIFSNYMKEVVSITEIEDVKILYLVSELLVHKSINITEIYLLGMKDNDIITMTMDAQYLKIYRLYYTCGNELTVELDKR